MLIAALNPQDGKIVQVALPDFDWGFSGSKTLAFVKHDDPEIEALLVKQIQDGGLTYVAYPYAVYDSKTRRMTDYSSENYDLTKLKGITKDQIADRTKDSPILDPVKDFTDAPIVKRIVGAVVDFFAKWF